MNDALARASLGGQEKLASLAVDLGTFVRDRLREVSVIDRILPPQMVTHSEVQRETDSNSFSMIVDLEPDSRATVVNLAGATGAHYVEGQRFKIPFVKVDTDEEQVKVTELPAYTYPITKVIEDNQVRDIQRAKDINSFLTANSIVLGTGKNPQIATGSGTLNKDMIRTLMNELDTDNLSADRLVMHKADFNDLMALGSDELGRDLASQVFVDGYTYTSVMGLKIVVTTEHEVCNPGRIYAFTKPDFIGKQFVLQDTHFSIEKRHDLLSWKMWQVLGIGFVNVDAVARMDIEDSVTRYPTKQTPGLPFA